jgi:hypothetical protein
MPDTAPAVPKTMRAAVVERFGGPEVLTVISVPAPAPGPGEILIAVNTAGVGGWDADMRAGWSPSGDALSKTTEIPPITFSRVFWAAKAIAIPPTPSPAMAAVRFTPK